MSSELPPKDVVEFTRDVLGINLSSEQEKILQMMEKKRTRELFVCPHHGEKIQEVENKEINLFGKIVRFFNLICERIEYCDTDISNDPELLKLLDGRVPLSQDKLWSKINEPNLEKAGRRTNDYCPYCGKKGGMSYVYIYLSGLLFPRTLQRYKMDCGHDFVIIYNIS